MKVGTIRDDPKFAADQESNKPVEVTAMFAATANPSVADALAAIGGQVSLLAPLKLFRRVWPPRAQKRRNSESIGVGGIKNPDVQVFGYGSWLKDQPDFSMDKWVAAAELQMYACFFGQLVHTGSRHSERNGYMDLNYEAVDQYPNSKYNIPVATSTSLP
ncbi:uncharacterized protein BCR38DRAFT_496889 [Pseudomassariella vexata]|uniref:Uncharacterized protein n=1 Tax=Pseudomassariella vexata TaxID=1141098 RepID=A0A1Y2DNQ6_9PEZI|nr:uncharacterized protein BCR38DRAFT_496889 [Pseudomassariella vexata]ORY60918.1 hypothetical protein BCR38DRAFT_496889 [Pseudomassariella vexata]